MLAFVVALLGLSSVESTLMLQESSANKAAMLATIGSYKTILWLTIIPGMLVIVAVAYFYWQTVVKPVYQLLQAIELTTENMDFTQTLQADSDTNIGHILESYNTLLSRLFKSFLHIQNITENLPM